MSNYSEKTIETIKEKLSKEFNVDIEMYDFCKLSIIALNNYIDKIKNINIVFEEDIISDFYIWNIENRINYFYELYSNKNDIGKMNQLRTKIYRYFENIIYINKIKNDILDGKRNIITINQNKNLVDLKDNIKNDDNVYNEEEKNYLDFKKLFEKVEFENDFNILNNLMNNILTEDQKKIILMKYEENLTLNEIASKLNCSRERIRQIENKILKRYRYQINNDKDLCNLKDYCIK